MSRGEINSLMDNILNVLKEHPECERYTNDLLKMIGQTTGYYAGTIRDIVEDFRKNGMLLTDDTIMTTGGGATGTAFGYPAINLTFGVKSEDTAVTLMHELLHWAGMRNIDWNTWSNYYTDDVLATAWNQLGVVMTVEEYRRTYPKHSAESAARSGSGNDFASSMLSGNAQFIACLNQWNSGFTIKHVDKPRP